MPSNLNPPPLTTTANTLCQHPLPTNRGTFKVCFKYHRGLLLIVVFVPCFIFCNFHISSVFFFQHQWKIPLWMLPWGDLLQSNALLARSAQLFGVWVMCLLQIVQNPAPALARDFVTRRAIPTPMWQQRKKVMAKVWLTAEGQRKIAYQRC